MWWRVVTQLIDSQCSLRSMITKVRVEGAYVRVSGMHAAAVYVTIQIAIEFNLIAFLIVSKNLLQML